MDYGGAENRLLELARQVDPQRFDFDFCTLQDQSGAYDEPLRKLGFQVFPCKLTRNIFRFSRRFREVLGQKSYNIIHTHVYLFSGQLLRLAAKQGVPKRIMHLRTARQAPRDSFYRICYHALMTRWIRKYSTHIVAVSQSSITAFMGDNWQNDPRTEVIYNGLNLKPFLESYDRQKTRAEFGISPQEKVVIHVGNFRAAKDHETLIRAAARICCIQGNTRFILVGDGPLKEPIKKLVQKLEIAPWVHFAGRRSDVPRLLMAADCFLFPSRWEGLPGALLEALAAGLTVVASNIGPNQEVAKVSDRVILVPQGDDQAYAREVMNVLADPDKHKVTPGQLPDTFRMDAFVNKILTLYEN